jgi:uncharacterized protein YfbU (UPF0304 family)
MSYAYAYTERMGTMTIRLDDRTHEELNAVARARGVSLSELTRGTLAALLGNDAGNLEQAGQAPVPTSLTTVERAQLSLMHRILAQQALDRGADGERDDHVRFAEILEQGYTADYDEVFTMIETEVSRQETNFVMDVLDMFEALERSYDALSSEDKATLGETAAVTLRFRGFDANSRREGRLLTYARRLIADDKWRALADRFDRKHDGGNSHMPQVDKYERMVAEFNPIWRVKLHEGAMYGGDHYNLSVTEIAGVLRAAVHPSNR